MDLFKLVHFKSPQPPASPSPIYVASTSVGKGVVGLRLNGFLFLYHFVSCKFLSELQDYPVWQVEEDFSALFSSRTYLGNICNPLWTLCLLRQRFCKHFCEVYPKQKWRVYGNSSLSSKQVMILVGPNMVRCMTEPTVFYKFTLSLYCLFPFTDPSRMWAA